MVNGGNVGGESRPRHGVEGEDVVIETGQDDAIHLFPAFREEELRETVDCQI